MKNFKCKRCGSCCHISPWVSRADIKRIERFGKKDFYEVAHNGLHFLKMVDGHCIFLKKNKKTAACKIYEARPTTCRLYPAKVRANGDCRPETLSFDSYTTNK